MCKSLLASCIFFAFICLFFNLNGEVRKGEGQDYEFDLQQPK